MFRRFRNIRSKLIFKITVFFIIAIILPLVAIAGYNLRYLKNQDAREELRNADNAILNFEQSFRNELYRYDTMITSLTKNRLITEYPEHSNDMDFVNDAHSLLNEFVHSDAAVYQSIAVYYFDHRFTATDIFRSADKVSEEKWYRDFFDSGKRYAWKAIFSEQENTLFYVGKIYKDVAEIGIVAVETPLSNVMQMALVENRIEASVLAFDTQSTGFYSNDPNLTKDSVEQVLAKNGFFEISRRDTNVRYYRDHNRLLAVNNLPEFSLTIGCVVESSSHKNFRNSLIVLLLVFLLLVIFAVVFYYFVISIFRTIENDVQEMNGFIENDFRGRLIIRHNDEIGHIEKQFNFMLDKLDALNKSVLLKEEAEKHSKILALQNQMSPHFIYNMLNLFRMKLVLKGDTETAEEIAKFGKLLRYNMSIRDHMAPLEEEVTYLNSYLDFQNERFAEKILYDDEIPAGYQTVKVPKLIFQTVAENAIKHGKKAKIPLKIMISYERIDDKTLEVSFLDNGKGCDETVIRSLNTQFVSGHYTVKPNTENSSHVGLKNINERMKLIFGEEYAITVSSVKDQYFEVVFKFPVKEG